MLKQFLYVLLIFMFSLGCEKSNLKRWGLDQQEQVGSKLAQQQLDAYNKRDIDAFMACYCEDVKVYQFPNELMMNGWSEMRARYQRMFAETQDLHCLLLNRMVQGNTVIDQELVTKSKDEPSTNAIAIYKISNDCIQSVHFISK
jgi:hypothetical protein